MKYIYFQTEVFQQQTTNRIHLKTSHVVSVGSLHVTRAKTNDQTMCHEGLKLVKRALYSVKGEAANSRGCQCRNTQAACTGASAKLAAQAVELATNRMFVRSKAVSRKRDPSASQQSLQNPLFFQPIISEMRFLSIFGFILFSSLFSQKVLFAGTF